MKLENIEGTYIKQKLGVVLIFLNLMWNNNINSQIIIYQDIFNGGVTGDAFNPWFNNVSGEFEINIEPGSTIRKAFLFVSVYNYPEERTIFFNGTPLTINKSNSIGNEYLYVYNANIRRIETIIIDVTDFLPHLHHPLRNFRNHPTHLRHHNLP